MALAKMVEAILALCRIRDTDMAEEMVNYSKNNILALLS